jgi:hypothetical protein
MVLMKNILNMYLDKYYNRFKLKNLTSSEEIVFELFEDLHIIKRIGYELEEMDDEIKEQMLSRWIKILDENNKS